MHDGIGHMVPPREVGTPPGREAPPTGKEAPPWMEAPPPKHTHTHGYGQCAGGMHPTGMHSR